MDPFAFIAATIHHSFKTTTLLQKKKKYIDYVDKEHRGYVGVRAAAVNSLTDQRSNMTAWVLHPAVGVETSLCNRPEININPTSVFFPLLFIHAMSPEF